MFYVSINPFQRETEHDKRFKTEVLENAKDVGEENVLIEPEKSSRTAGCRQGKVSAGSGRFPESPSRCRNLKNLPTGNFSVTARGGGVGYTGGAVPIDAES